ncbi:MAG: hypothetical protein EOO53_02520 [Gammaproteobacteria bacterium]|nr:MAG: hypothetical protein EOO53_02520 [Gammaproteobacteria bacterium]
MNFQLVKEELDLVAKTSGVIACALVEADTGMIYLSTSKSIKFEVIAEGARDYWSLHNKNGNIFDEMGTLNSILIQHSKGLLTIQPCGEKTILITLAKLKKMDWKAWPKVIQPLRELIDDSQ